MSLTKKRWLVLVSSCIINLCIGSVYAWSVFSSPLAQHINALRGTALTAGDLSVVFTVYNAVVPFIVLFGGAIDDKIGPKPLAIIGAVLFGSGTILSGYVHSVGLLALTYGLMGGVGINLCYVCSVSNTLKLFPDRRGLASGLVTATYGLSSVIISPVAGALIEKSGITSALTLLGIIYTAVILLCAIVQCRVPESFTPEGYTPGVNANAVCCDHDENWWEMVHDGRFYPMIMLMFCATFFGTMVISQASPIGRETVGMSAAAAAAAVSVLAAFNALGRIGAGAVSDKIGSVNTMTAALLCALGGLGVLFFTGTGQVLLYYVGMALVGLAYGAFMSILPGFNVDTFGQSHSAVNYGVLDIGYAAAGIIGPLLVSGVHASTGSYTGAFAIAGGIAVMGIAMTFLFRHIVNNRIMKKR